MGICASPLDRRLFVADTFNNKIKMLELNTETITTLNIAHGKDCGMVFEDVSFNAPEGITCALINTQCDGDSCIELPVPLLRLFIADTGSNNIVVADLQEGQVLRVAIMELLSHTSAC